MKHIITLIFIIITVTSSTVLSLLVNYASAPIPQFLLENPNLIWMLCGLIVLIIIFSAYGSYFVENWKPQLTPLPMKSHPRSEGAMTNYKYDVFISYSHKDKNWVHETLIPKLRQHGFSVLVDTDFLGGSFGLAQMEEGVRDSKRVIAIFSEDYFKSDWSTLENVMAQILDPATKQRKLIPIMLKDCKVPLRLAGIHYRDLRQNEDQEWFRLIQDLM